MPPRVFGRKSFNLNTGIHQVPCNDSNFIMKALGSYLGAVAQCHVDGSVITTAAAEVIGGSSNLPNDSSPMTPIGSAFVG